MQFAASRESITLDVGASQRLALLMLQLAGLVLCCGAVLFPHRVVGGHRSEAYARPAPLLYFAFLVSTATLAGRTVAKFPVALARDVLPVCVWARAGVAVAGPAQRWR